MADPAGHMRSASDARAWFRDAGALTVAPPEGWPADEIATAAAAAGRLVATARGLVTAQVVRPGSCARPCGTCADLVGTCGLVRALAAVPLMGPAGTADAEVGSYLAALGRGGNAVFVCRRTLHRAGTCLFAGDASDLCARVLAAAHRLG